MHDSRARLGDVHLHLQLLRSLHIEIDVANLRLILSAVEKTFAIGIKDLISDIT